MGGHKRARPSATYLCAHATATVQRSNSLYATSAAFPRFLTRYCLSINCGSPHPPTAYSATP
eukprot:1740381-Pleurochrysis_carterae.AAC.1